MTTRWRTSGSGNGSSPTPTTPWPARAIWTPRCWWSPSTSGAGSTTTCRRPGSPIEHRGPYEHSSTLKLIESTFGLHPITARETHALDLGRVLDRHPRRPAPAGAIPTSSQVLGPVSDAAAICSADSAQSVSPAPVRRGKRPAQAPPLSPSGVPSGAGMVEFGRRYRQQRGG